MRQEHSAYEHEPERDREREARRDLGIDPGLEGSTKPAVVTDLSSDGFCHGDRATGFASFEEG